jgi:hypothetical protein
MLPHHFNARLSRLLMRVGTTYYLFALHSRGKATHFINASTIRSSKSKMCVCVHWSHVDHISRGTPACVHTCCKVTTHPSKRGDQYNIMCTCHRTLVTGDLVLVEHGAGKGSNTWTGMCSVYSPRCLPISLCRLWLGPGGGSGRGVWVLDTVNIGV